MECWDVVDKEVLIEAIKEVLSVEMAPYGNKDEQIKHMKAILQDALWKVGQ